MATYEIRPLTADTWDAFAELVERHHGVWGGCWCLEFHPEGNQKGVDRRGLKECRVRAGEAHAALVFDGERCVGWCQFGSPEELPRIKFAKAYRQTSPALPDWRITCFFVDREYRRTGVADAALEGALREIARLGGGTVESSPETSPAGRCRTRSSGPAPSRCSNATASPEPANSASTPGW